jgi:hypothetical protein
MAIAESTMVLLRCASGCAESPLVKDRPVNPAISATQSDASTSQGLCEKTNTLIDLTQANSITYYGYFNKSLILMTFGTWFADIKIACKYEWLSYYIRSIHFIENL